jgi:hypothetical protein
MYIPFGRSTKYQALGFHCDAIGAVKDWIPLMKLERVKCPWAVLWRLGYKVKKEKVDHGGNNKKSPL